MEDNLSNWFSQDVLAISESLASMRYNNIVTGTLTEAARPLQNLQGKHDRAGFETQ